MKHVQVESINQKQLHSGENHCAKHSLMGQFGDFSKQTKIIKLKTNLQQLNMI